MFRRLEKRLFGTECVSMKTEKKTFWGAVLTTIKESGSLNRGPSETVNERITCVIRFKRSDVLHAVIVLHGRTFTRLTLFCIYTLMSSKNGHFFCVLWKELVKKEVRKKNDFEFLVVWLDSPSKWKRLIKLCLYIFFFFTRLFPLEILKRNPSEVQTTCLRFDKQIKFLVIITWKQINPDTRTQPWQRNYRIYLCIRLFPV